MKPATMRLPSAKVSGTLTSAAMMGMRKLRRSVSGAERRQASSGAAPISSSRAKKIGPLTRLKYGAFSEILSPITNSEMLGKMVPRNVAAMITTKITFCVRKLVSRESTASSWLSLFSSGRRHTSSARKPSIVRTMKTANMGPTAERAKECTDCTTPLRVRNVPINVSSHVSQINTMFQTLSIPRRSWIMMLWMNAVAVSQGRKDAFSTGSQAQ